MINRSYIFILYIILFIVILLSFWDIWFLLSKSLPFEKHYELNPFSFFLHVSPLIYILYIIFIFRFDSLKSIKIIIFIWFIQALLINIFIKEINIFSLYLYLYIPVFSLLYYWIINFFVKKTNIIEFDVNKKVNSRLEYYLLLIPFLLLLLNLIPSIFSPYLVWSDVYFHSNITKEFSFDNPFFYESKKILYPKLWYNIIFLISNLLEISHIQIWIYMNSIFSFLIFTFLILIMRKIRINLYWKILALFFIFPLWQFLFTDPSIRIVGYFFLLVQVYLLLNNKNLLWILFSPIIFFVHYEIWVHSILMLLFYYSINKFVNFKNDFISKEIEKQDSFNKFNNKILSLVLLSSIIIFWIFFKYKSDLTNFSFRNDIPLSFGTPVWIISFISLLWFIIYFIRNEINKSHYILIWISLLFTDVFFFYSYLWDFYHRYFFETAYIWISILAWVIYWDILVKSNYKKLYMVIIVLFLIISVFPRFKWINWYSIGINNFVSWNINTFKLVKDNLNKKVLLIHPDNYLNRYIPLFTDNYVYWGNFHREDNLSYNILPFCWWFDLKQICFDRYFLLNKLYTEPSISNLKEIQSNYKADYILLRSHEEKLFLSTDLKDNLEFVSWNSLYRLFKIIN